MSNGRRTLPAPLLFGTFLCAYLAMILSVPEFLRFLRPNLVVLLVIFWLIRIPENLGVGFAWIAGFFYDGITGGFLGQHALSFSFIAYIVLVLHQRIRLFAGVQQALLVFLLLVLEQMIDGWIDMIVRGDDYHFYFLINAILGALCWPVLSAWLNRYQRLFI